MLDLQYKDSYRFEDVTALMEILRQRCPWDSEQTHASIRQNLVEEAYEVCEGIDADDPAILREELGDLLLQVVFHSRIEQEKGNFSINDVCDQLVKKLIHRHPHIFAEGGASTSGEVLDVWESIKRADKGGHVKSVASVAKSLPSLMRAGKIQSRAIAAGFGFTSADAAWDKMEEELSELRAATGLDSLEDEVGDVLFMAVNLARINGVDPERACERACDKFTRLFTYMQETAGDLTALTPEEKERLWTEAKSSVQRDMY